MKDLTRRRYPGILRLGEGTYRIRVSAVDPRTGKLKEVYRRRTGITVQEAVKLQGEWREEIRRGEAGGRERMRLRDYAASWLRGRLPRLKPSTAHGYATMLDVRILPALGDYYLDALTPADVNTWLGKQGRSAPNCLLVLRTLLRDAVADLDLPRDPVARVKAPRRRVFTDEEPGLLTAEELRRVLDAFRAEEPRWYALAATLAFTGLRWGEATALRWDDVDEPAGVLHVRRAQWRGIVSTTKTDRVRSVPLVPELADVLREHRRGLVASQHAGVAEGWMFPSVVGKLHQASAMRKPLLHVLRVAGVTRGITVHGLRRTFNNLARQVASGEVVRSITGHVTAAMTEHYSHVDVREKRAAAAGVLRLVRGGQLGDPLGDPVDRGSVVETKSVMIARNGPVAHVDRAAVS